ncbi:MAG: protein kinase, partial [Deltaproteobacteria bacterium]|nr:protein kinase [Deltaproteobacteria bacterium]
MAGTIHAGRYEILDEVGQGGMATVYRARDLRLGRVVALKVLHPFLAGNERNRRRFHREAQVVGRLRHENIVEIFDYSGIDSRDAFIVSELIEGGTLKDFVEAHGGTLLSEVAALILLPVARALGHAHDGGVIHRDVKPENIMITRAGGIKITDFGIAQVLDSEHMTTTGTMVGSPAYMSPEHIEGRSLDHRADIFSLGTIAYMLACRELPFQGENPHALLRNILEVRFAPPERLAPGIAPGFAKVIRTCLQRDPGDRYSSCHELVADLERVAAAAGLDRPEDELPRFFQAPAAFSTSLRQRLTDTEVAEGRRVAGEGRLVVAMRHLDRALALDPGRRDVLEIAAQHRRRQLLRQRIRRAARWVLAGLVIGGLAGGAVLGGLHLQEPPARILPLEPPADPPPSPDRASATPVRPVQRQEPGLPRPVPEGVAPASPHPRADPGALPALPGAGGAEGDVAGPERRPDAAARLGRGARALGSRVEHLVAVLREGAGIRGDAERSRPVMDPVRAYQELRKIGPIRPGLSRARPIRDGVREGNPALRPPGGPDEANPQGHGTAEAAATTREVTIMVTPPAAEIWVDEVLRGSGRVEGLALGVGMHRLRLHHPSCGACEDLERSLEVRADMPGPV